MPFAPLFIAILYFIHPHLFWITLGGAVVLAFLAIFNQWAGSGANQAAGENVTAAMNTAQAYARNSETLQAMGMVENGIAIWGKTNAEALRALDSSAKSGALFTGLSRTIRTGLQIAVLGYGAYLVLDNQMTAGMIFASSIISGRGLQPIDQVIGGWRQYVATWAAWRRLRAMLAAGKVEKDHTQLPALNGAVSSEGLIVAAPGSTLDNAILKRVSFALKPGETLGVVGPSGAGKSTLARVLAGAIAPQAGKVRLDGVDISNWDRIDLGRQIGYLSQEVELLPGTVAENIARLDGNADSECVLAAARKAQVHELILELPQGYDTQLGPGGFVLSGGQRQRVALARAFYGDPKLIILDEPNANLDDDGDKALHRALMSVKQEGATVIIITQRPQVLQLTDKILRLHQGGVDFFGTQQEFVAKLNALKQQAMEQQARQSRPAAEPGAEPAKKQPNKNVVKASFGPELRAKKK